MNLPLSLNLLAFLALLLGLAQTRRTDWSLAKKVLLGLVLGVVFGLVLHTVYGAGHPVLKATIAWLDLVGNGYVGLLQMTQGVQGEQARIARAGTNQHHLPTASGGLLIQQLLGEACGGGVITTRQCLTKSIGSEQPLPKAAPSAGRQTGFDPLTPATGKFGQFAQMMW